MSAIPSVPPTLPAPEPAWILSPLYRMTVDGYEAMIESGASESRNRFHLINGYLVAKMTQNLPRRVADELCGAELERIVPADRYHVPGASRSGSLGESAIPSPIAASCGGRSAITRTTAPGRTILP